MKEFNLSDRINIDINLLKQNDDLIKVKDVKEFIKQDTELINQFACGNITLLELKQEREKFVVEKLKVGDIVEIKINKIGKTKRRKKK